MYRHPFLSDAQREAIESAHFDSDEREIEFAWGLFRHPFAEFLDYVIVAHDVAAAVAPLVSCIGFASP